MDGSQVTALNFANAAMGIFVVGLFLAVGVAAVYDVVSTIRRKRSERGSALRAIQLRTVLPTDHLEKAS